MKSGIYGFRNKINNKWYVGFSINVDNRYKAHIRNFNCLEDEDKKNPRHLSPLYYSMVKHGIENFDYTILERCPKDVLGERETWWIAEKGSYKNGYNLTRGGEGNLKHGLSGTPEYSRLNIYYNVLKENGIDMSINELCEMWKDFSIHGKHQKHKFSLAINKILPGIKDKIILSKYCRYFDPARYKIKVNAGKIWKVLTCKYKINVDYGDMIRLKNKRKIKGYLMKVFKDNGMKTIGYKHLLKMYEADNNS